MKHKFVTIRINLPNADYLETRIVRQIKGSCTIDMTNEDLYKIYDIVVKEGEKILTEEVIE